jgi:hypothetical protein
MAKGKDSTIVRKVTVKTVCGELDPATEYRPLMKVYGILTGIKKTDSAYDGEDNCFIGRIEAVNVKTGEVFQASKAYLPEPATSMLESKFVQDGTNKVQFAYMIGVTKPTDPKRNKAGYEFTAKDLLEKDDTELDSLRNAIK